MLTMQEKIKIILIHGKILFTYLMKDIMRGWIPYELMLVTLVHIKCQDHVTKHLN